MKNHVLNFAHICDSAFLSQDGKLNLIGIFKGIRVMKFPMTYPRMSCVLNLTIKKDAKLKVQILKKKSREVIAKLEGNLNYPREGTEDEIEVGFMSDFNNVRFEEEGDYYFEIWLNDDIIKTIPFKISIIIKK